MPGCNSDIHAYIGCLDIGFLGFLDEEKGRICKKEKRFII